MPQIDFKRIAVRAAAILTTAYVPGTVITKTQEYNQLKLFVDITMGSLTTVELKIEFSDDNSSFYKETDETSSVTSNVDTKGVNTVIHQFSFTDQYRLLIPIVDANVRVSVKGTGTVAGSSVAINGALVKNYS